MYEAIINNKGTCLHFRLGDDWNEYFFNGWIMTDQNVLGGKYFREVTIPPSISTCEQAILFINHPFLPQVRTLNQRKGGFPGDITNESSIVVTRVAVTCQLYIRKLMEIKGPHWTWVLFSGPV